MSRRGSSSSSTWQEVILLGEQLLKTADLAAQRDQIVHAVAHLLDARVELWLDERLSRLPGLNQISLFPTEPTSDLMRQALSSSSIAISKIGSTPKIALPLKSQDVVIGVLQASRQGQKRFSRSEMNLLNGMAGHISLALVASHRFAIEQWRIEQLTLVRRVSAQIANVLDLRELTRRVTKSILRTFRYYYVAIFTLEPGQKVLRFQASAGPAGRRGKHRESPVLHVELGQGLIGSVAESGVEIVTNDVGTEPRFRSIDVLRGTKSEVALPLRIEDQILGVLDIQSDRRDAFHPNDLLVLHSLADTIAIAVNNARLFGDLQTRAEQLAIVSEVSDDITSILNLDELLAKVASLIQSRLGYPYVHLFTVHPNRKQIIYEAGSGKRSEAYKGYILNLDKADGMIPWVARNGKTILANDVTKDPRYLPTPFPPDDTCSELTIPLIYNNQVNGVLDLQSNRPNAFTQDDRMLFEALADNVAVAIHNSDLFRTERWRRQVADSLREVAGLLSSDFGVDDVLDRVLRELERNLPCDVSAIWFLEAGELHLAHVHGADILEVESAARRWPEAYDFLVATLAADGPVIRKPDDPIGPSGLAGGFSADYSSIAIALRVADRPLGVLTLSHHSPNRYGHEAQAVTTTFASYASVAIENARLYDNAQEQAYASAALLQVAQAVVVSGSLEESLASIVRITPILVGVHACAVFLWEAEEFRPSHIYGFTDDAQAVLWGRNFRLGDFQLLDVVRDSAQMVVGALDSTVPGGWLDPEITRDDQETEYILQTGDHLMLGFPLMIKNDFYGVMVVEETAEARRFRQKRVEIIQGIAQQVALNIQNEHLQQEMVARERLEHEIQLARQIQQTLLPERLPQFPNWDLAATWRTARQVGGDFYDVIELPGGNLGLFIADVSDKGIPAALFMALTRTLVRAVIYNVTSPSEVMRRVNELMIPDNQQAMFVTAVYGVLSLNEGEFTFANLGHNPPVWLHSRTGNLESLRPTGVALGIIESAPIGERTIRLENGDFLLLYTDGLTEAFSPKDEIYGEERLYQVLNSVDRSSSREILDAIETSVDQFIGSEPVADDLTMLGLRRMG